MWYQISFLRCQLIISQSCHFALTIIIPCPSSWRIIVYLLLLYMVNLEVCHWRQYPQAFWVADVDRFHWEVSHHGCRRKSLSYPRGYVGSFIRISLAFFAEDWSWNHERWRRLTQWDRHHQRSVWLANKRRNFAAWIPWIARENTKSVDKQTSRKWGKWVWKLFFECFALYFETVIQKSLFGYQGALYRVAPRREGKEHVKYRI